MFPKATPFSAGYPKRLARRGETILFFSRLIVSSGFRKLDRERRAARASLCPYNRTIWTEGNTAARSERRSNVAQEICFSPLVIFNEADEIVPVGMR